MLYGVKPWVVWSGHGYHIIIPVYAKEGLENFEDLTTYITKPSKEFLQFAVRCLSMNKSDKANNPGFKSCLLRVPYTLNSKCIDEGIDSEVKVVHQWDSCKPLPEIDNLLIEFQTFLVDQKLKTEIKEKKCKKDMRYSPNSCSVTNTIPYVERLFDMPIVDYRKNAISLILAPYFINIQHLSDADSFGKIKKWALRCNDLKN